MKKAWAAIALAMMLAGCGEPPGKGTGGCTAGDQLACSCGAGTAGTAVCDQDGNLGACQCTTIQEQDPIPGGGGGGGGGGVCNDPCECAIDVAVTYCGYPEAAGQLDPESCGPEEYPSAQCAVDNPDAFCEFLVVAQQEDAELPVDNAFFQCVVENQPTVDVREPVETDPPEPDPGG